MTISKPAVSRETRDGGPRENKFMARLRAEVRARLGKAASMEPEDWQEQHSPTEAVEVRFNQARRVYVELCRRRALDARLLDDMTSEQLIACQRIVDGFQAIVGPVQAKTASLERIDGDRGPDADHTRRHGLIANYRGWAKRCHIERLYPHWAVEILAMGKTCAEVDAERRCRKGTARDNLFECLSVYCRMKGWSGPHRRTA